MERTEIIEQLRSSGLRPTADRISILKRFEEARAWTASELHEALEKMDLSTVYRNLAALEGHGLISSIPSPDGAKRYERTGRDHHDHARCERCSGVTCIPCPVPEMADHTLELSERCEACATL